ncbi:MAG: hypothetical protein P9L92_07530 [Candidatus Electryonea clarkiae]|nr:hypothetical protein [Candidatus Electryonea clarkiae]
MAYCPTDRIEYNDEIDECLVCGGPLIEGVVETLFGEVDENDWVELDPLPELVHAVKVRDALDDDNILCHIKAEIIQGAEYCGSQAIVFVQESQYDESLEIQQGIAPPDDDMFIVDPDAEDDW